MLDEAMMDLYPDDGVIHGIADHIIYNHVSDVHAVFAEETARFSEHPAQMFIVDPTDDHIDGEHNADSDVLMKSMGVADPEYSKVSGRVFTALALQTLLPTSSEGPKLEFSRGHTPLTEYHNPALVPEIFPTLFPYSISGLDNDARPTPLSLHANKLNISSILLIGGFGITVHICSLSSIFSKGARHIISLTLQSAVPISPLWLRSYPVSHLQR